VPARVRLALMVFASLAILAAAGVIFFTRAEAPPPLGASGFAGGLRPPIAPQDFTLRDQDGHLVSLRDYRGQVVVLTFLYSTCQDTCPVTATTIRGALDELGHDVPALAISVDPPNDTPASARKFLAEQRANGRIRFVLGSRTQLHPIWNGYGITPQRITQEHLAHITLVDGRGFQRVGYPIAQATPERLAHDLRLLERESG
jgi:protein SCO1/2